MFGILQEVGLAFRLLRHSPGLSMAAVVTLALGIGANTTIYSFAHAVLFRGLDVPDADRIVHVSERRQQPGRFPLSFAEYSAYRDGASSFEALAAHYSGAPLHAVIDGTPEPLTGAVTTASYFDVLQLRPFIGRFFAASEDRARDRDALLVISHSLWQRRFGGDRSVLGRPLTIDDRVFTIIGVAPAGFVGVQSRAAAVDVWMPSAMFNVGYRYCDAFAPGCAIVHLIGRLRPGVRPDAATRELDGIAAHMPAEAFNERQRLGLSVRPARGAGDAAQSSERRQLDLFLAAVTLVLIVSCANIAGLLLARSATRKKHIALRLAVGASRRRIAGHVLAESLVLALLGGACGILAAAWGIDLLAALYGHDSAGRPLAFDLSLNAPVLAAAFGLTLLCALLAGGIPAWLASRADLLSVLKDEGGSSGLRRAPWRGVLVTAQVAVSVVLLIGATLLMFSAHRVLQGPGFAAAEVITLRLRPSLVGYSRARAHAYQRAAIERLHALPGVVSASPSVYLSMFSAGAEVRVTMADGDVVDVLGNAVGERYFATLGVPLVTGREFDRQDRTGAPLVAVVNDVLARRLSPDERVVGTTLVADGRAYTVVGIVRDAQYYASGDGPRPQAFFSYWQTGDEAFMNDSRTFVKVTGDTRSMAVAAQRALASVDAAVPISEVHPLEERIAYMFQPVRTTRSLLTAAALLALVLSVVGLYGVLAQSIAERTREIGLRVAVGAAPSHIAYLVMRDASRLVLSGVGIGLLGAWQSTHLIDGLLFGLTSRDPLPFLAAPLVIIAVASVATALPMRRAIRISPLSALRLD